MKPKKNKNNYNSKNKKQKNTNEPKLNGFSTLNQVTGSPQQSSHHSKIDLQKVKEIKEPKPICELCEKVIENVSTAMYSPNNELVHFDCVLEDIKSKTRLEDHQTISYIGKGTFAICEKGEDGKFTIGERIVYESPEQVLKLKDYVEAQKI